MGLLDVPGLRPAAPARFALDVAVPECGAPHAQVIVQEVDSDEIRDIGISFWQDAYLRCGQSLT